MVKFCPQMVKTVHFKTMVKYGQILSKMLGFGEIWSKLVKFVQIWSNFFQKWSNVVKNGQI